MKVIFTFLRQNHFSRIVFSKLLFLFLCAFLSTISVFSQNLVSYYDSALAYKYKDLEKYDFYIQKLFSESQKQKNEEYLLKSYYLKSTIFYEKAKNDSCVLYINKTLNLATLLNNDTLKWDIFRLKGFFYKNRLYNLDSAAFCFQLALQKSKQSNYKYGQVKCLEAISFLLMDKGKYIDATQYLLEARQIAYEIKNKDAQSSVASNIGHVYLKMQMYERALPFFYEAERYRKDKTTVSVIPLNIAECYYKTGNYAQAIAIFEKNVPLSLKTSLNMAIEYHLQAISLYLEINQPQKALEKVTILDSLLTRAKPQSYRQFLLLKARTYLHLKDTLKAHTYIKEVEKEIPENTENDFSNRLVMHELFSSTYAFLKEYKMANYHSQKYISLYKTTYNRKLEQDIYESEVNQRMLLQEKESELEKIKYANNIEKEQQNKKYFFVLLATLFIIFVIIIRAYWTNKKYSKELKNTNNQLFKTQQEVIAKNSTLHDQAEELTRQAEELSSSHEEVMAMNNNLESLVNDRNQEVVEKNKMLEEYAFINAHKLRAPVARLLGIMQLIEITQNTEEINYYLQLCNQEVKDLDRIVWAIKEAIEEKAPLDRWELEKRKEKQM